MSQVQAENTIRALNQTGTSIQKLFAQLPSFAEAQLAEIQQNANTIADQEAAIAANEESKKVAVRNAEAEIRLQVKEDADKVLGELLTKRGLVATTQAEIDQANQQIQEAEAKAARTEFDAVKQAESRLHAQYKGQISELTANHKVELATYTANAGRDADLINSLRNQVAGLEKTIEANREAETARTTALASSQVTINQGGK